MIALRRNTRLRFARPSSSPSGKHLCAKLRTVRIIMTDTITAAAVWPLGKLGSPGNRPLPTDVTGRGRSTSHLTPVTYSIGAADTTTSRMTTRLLPVIRKSTAASAATIVMQPTVENRYASTAEQSRNPSGSVAKVCKILVSRVVAIAELRSATPIIGTMPHNMAVAITTAAALAILLFFICIIPVKHSSPCRCHVFTSGVSPKNDGLSFKALPRLPRHARHERPCNANMAYPHRKYRNDARIEVGVQKERQEI